MRFIVWHMDLAPSAYEFTRNLWSLAATILRGGGGRGRPGGSLRGLGGRGLELVAY